MNLIKNKRKINLCDVYTFLWMLYNFHLYDSIEGIPSIITSIPLGINLPISIYYFFFVNRLKYLPPYLKGLNLLVLMFTIYGLLLIASGDIHRITFHNSNIIVSNPSYIVGILRSLLPIYAYYAFTVTGRMGIKRFKIWIFIFFIQSILVYFLTASRLAFVTGESEFTNNASYLLLSLIPLLFLFESKKIQYILLFILMALIVSSMKRGAMFVSGVLSILFLYETFRSSTKKQKFRTLLFICICLLVSIKYLAEFYSENEYFQGRINQTMEGNVSGRDVIANDILTYFFYEASILQVVIGSGANATLDVTNNYAHNDWLEILINHGLLGLFIYLIYWILFYYNFIKIQNDKTYKIVFGLIVCHYFLISFFSMSYVRVSTFSAMALGYILYYAKFKKNTIKT